MRVARLIAMNICKRGMIFLGKLYTSTAVPSADQRVHYEASDQRD